MIDLSNPHGLIVHTSAIGIIGAWRLIDLITKVLHGSYGDKIGQNKPSIPMVLLISCTYNRNDCARMQIIRTVAMVSGYLGRNLSGAP